VNRHVIKGRGENRGKYLCYAHVVGLSTDAGYAWRPEQRKAARWRAPGYGETHEKRVAREHNGYFVKLVASRLPVAELRRFISAHAAGAAERLACHWFDGDFHDASEDFCRDCAEKLVDEKFAADPKRFEDLYGECEDAEERYSEAIDGGYRTEHDSRPSCATCGAPLDGSLTDYGVGEEIEAMTADANLRFDDAESWEVLHNALIDVPDDDPRWRKIARTVEAARKEEAEHRARQSAIAAAPGMPEARTALLDLLSARAGQKAPEPSFRSWEELKAYLRIPFEERDRATGEVRDLERRLFKEAEAFAKLLGYRWRGESIEAPYGTYWWPFVVQVEQYKLWRPPAFEEGRAYMLHPCPSGDPEWPHRRDANPYPEGSDEHDAWDAGYISAPKDRQ
jgi:hypothetical protein